jgi:hypothetical protein
MKQQWKKSSGKRKDRAKLRKQNRFDGFLSVTLSFFLMLNVVELYYVECFIKSLKMNFG